MSEHAAVKECDIRGPWPEEVDATFFEQAGRNFGATVAGGSFAGFHPATVVVSGDGRASTPALRAALQGGLLAEGVDVFDVVGATPTPALYWIRQVLAAQAVAIVTASHSPPHWNGLKVMNGPLPPTPAEVEALDVAPPPRREAGRRHAIGNVVDTYVAARIAPFAAAGLPGLDVVVDPGGGCMAGVASRAFRELGAAVDALHDELDPAFRQRHPDCAVPKHLAELAARVPAIGAAMGVAVLHRHRVARRAREARVVAGLADGPVVAPGAVGGLAFGVLALARIGVDLVGGCHLRGRRDDVRGRRLDDDVAARAALVVRVVREVVERAAGGDPRAARRTDAAGGELSIAGALGRRPGRVSPRRAGACAQRAARVLGAQS